MDLLVIRDAKDGRIPGMVRLYSFKHLKKGNVREATFRIAAGKLRMVGW
jgi:hypothetical protein